MKYSEYDAEKILECLEDSKSWKNSVNQFQTITDNHKVYEGDLFPQSLKTLPKVKFNISKKITDFLVSIINGYKLNPNYIVIGKKDGGVYLDEEKMLLSKALNKYASESLERINFNFLQLQAVLASAIEGNAYIHGYWDETLETGNYSKGDVNLELIPTPNIHFSNTTSLNPQDNIWIMIEASEFKDEIKYKAKIAKEQGLNHLDEKDINNLTTYSGSTGYSYYNQNQPSTKKDLENSDKSSLLIFYYKNYDDGKIHQKVLDVASQNFVIEDVNTQLDLFPIASMPWYIRNGSCWGQGIIEQVKTNQIFINFNASLITVQKILNMPLTVANRNMTQNSKFTNEPGKVLMVSGNPDEAIKRYGSSNMAAESYKDIENLINMTYDAVGMNRVDLQQITVDSGRALQQYREMAQQPLANVKINFEYFIRQILLMFLDFYTNFLPADDEEVRTVQITNDVGGVFDFPISSSLLEDLVFNVKITFSESSVYNDLDNLQTFLNLLEKGIIELDTKEILDVLPDNLIPYKDRILATINKRNRQQELEDLENNQEISKFQERLTTQNIQQPQQEIPQQQEIPTEQTTNFNDEAINVLNNLV